MSAEQRQNDVIRDTGGPSDPASPHEVALGNRLALSVEEAGALLGISRDLAYDLVACGNLPSVRWGGGSSSLAGLWRRHWSGWSGLRSITVRVVRLVVAAEPREA